MLAGGRLLPGKTVWTDGRSPPVCSGGTGCSDASGVIKRGCSNACTAIALRLASQLDAGYWDMGFFDSLDSRVPVDSQ